MAFAAITSLAVVFVVLWLVVGLADRRGRK